MTERAPPLRPEARDRVVQALVRVLLERHREALRRRALREVAR